MDGGEQHQPDDRAGPPNPPCEGTQRCPRNAAPTTIVVVPCLHPPCLDTGVSGDAVAAPVPPCSLRDRGVGLRPDRAPPRCAPAGPGPRRAEGHAPRDRAAGPRRHRCAGRGVVCDRPRCWAVGVAGPGAAAGTGTVIVATANGGRHVEGPDTWPAAPRRSSAAVVLPVARPAAWRSGRTGIASRQRRRGGDQRRGAHWAPATAPATRSALTGVQCESTADCTAIVSDGAVTWSAHSGDFGQSWQQEGQLPPNFIAGDDLSASRRPLPRPGVHPHEQRPRSGCGRGQR